MFDKWDKRFIEMARLVSTWASCYQPERKIGAVIVLDKRVLPDHAISKNLVEF